MKKILLAMVTLTMSIGLVACGNSDNSTKKTNHQETKTEKQKTNKAKTEKTAKDTSAKNDSKDDEAAKSNDSSATNEQSGSNSANETTQAQNTQTTQPARSQKDETNGRGNVVTSASQAITVLSNGLGNNSDFAYAVLSTDNHMYKIQVTSKSIRAQGGTGTLGTYIVREDGTYYLEPISYAK